MRRNKLSRFGIAAAALCGLCCLHCGEPIAGTSTTVGNSITARALRADGSPATGAQVAARTQDIVLQSGQPQSRLLASATADSSGRFTLPVSPRADYYLEIRECGSDSCAAAPPIEVFFQHYFDSLAMDSSLGTLRLAPAAALTGRLVDTTAHAAGTVTWVGIRGTADFARVNPAADSLGGEAFEIEGVYVGAYDLAAVFATGAAVDAVTLLTLPAPISTPQVVTGAVIDLGPVYYAP